MLEVSLEKSLGKFMLKSSFQAKKGVLGILGPSGCGKSTMLKCIAGLYTPDIGSIKLNGKVLFSSTSKINVPPRKRNIGYVFQNYALFPRLTVRENIAYGIHHLGGICNQKVSDMIERMQLVGLEEHYPSQLSGGQQQRTALARTLITEPDLLLLDEPLSALDSHIKYKLEKELITIIKNNYNGVVLLVTHNIEEAYRICNDIMIMENGQNHQFGTKEEVINTPANLAAAKITGCKNLLDVSILEEQIDYLVLKANGLIFKASKLIEPTSRQMIAGIRAHHLSLSTTTPNTENTFECDIIEKIEGLFSSTIVVNCRGCILQAEIPKSSSLYSTGYGFGKMKLYIPPDQVFLIEKEKLA
ncbi:sulfate/molybdate ABC transporter ATP-binding protein [Desulfitobacterium sp. AusDCA]|uniref:sulfate/molybdate ABC transporter ATP-binding protein n=1 Tax=Desulfitobacterium sp. AusDCA TaxID=3240383 RepID=UPI003DA75360